jgi:hypothetical protein
MSRWPAPMPGSPAAGHGRPHTVWRISGALRPQGRRDTSALPHGCVEFVSALVQQIGSMTSTWADDQLQSMARTGACGQSSMVADAGRGPEPAAVLTRAPTRRGQGRRGTPQRVARAAQVAYWVLAGGEAIRGRRGIRQLADATPWSARRHRDLDWTGTAVLRLRPGQWCCPHPLARGQQDSAISSAASVDVVAVHLHQSLDGSAGFNRQTDVG